LKKGGVRKRLEEIEARTGMKGNVNWEDVRTKLSVLATEGGKHKAKKDTAIQRSSFRDILRTVEDATLPSEVFEIAKMKHEIEGWSLVKQLQAFRSALAKGMHVHFLHNELLSDVFELTMNGDGEDQKETKKKNQALSKEKAKEAYQQHNKLRRKKTAHLNEDDE